MIWSLADVLAYLDEHRITFVVFKNQPSLDSPDGTPPAVVNRVLPHVKARRAELIEWFEGMKNAQNDGTREAVLNCAVHRAAALGKVVYLLVPTGHVLELADAGNKAKRKAAEGATWVCVAGDDKWTRLPDE